MGNPSPRSARPGTIALNLPAFNALSQQYELRSDAEIARALGVTRSTVWKVRRGVTMPSERFIAGALRAWPGAEFRELFIPVDYVPRGRGKAA